MREIKFRAWDKVKKEWWDDTDSAFEIYLDGKFLGLDSDRDWNEDYILSQYTGLKDKYGKAIYEGDVVKCYVSEKSDDYLLLEAKNGYVIRTISIPEVYQESLPENCEVIGNVYENLELLKT